MIQKLISKIEKTHAPIVVGLDPMLNYIPRQIQEKAFKEYGETLKGAGEAIWQYNKEIIDHVYDLIPAVKPQIAMYEQFGIEGLIAFKKTVDYCKEKDLVVIGDVKRGDIGSTSAAYAVGHLGKVQVGSQKFAGFDIYRVHAQLAVRILFAANPRKPCRQVAVERAAADLTQTVFLRNAVHFEKSFSHSCAPFRQTVSIKVFSTCVNRISPSITISAVTPSESRLYFSE